MSCLKGGSHGGQGLWPGGVPYAGRGGYHFLDVISWRVHRKSRPRKAQARCKGEAREQTTDFGGVQPHLPSGLAKPDLAD